MWNVLLWNAIATVDFTWQEIRQTSIHLLKLRWNDHLVGYLSLLHHYGINKIYCISHFLVQNSNYFVKNVNHYRNL